MSKPIKVEVVVIVVVVFDKKKLRPKFFDPKTIHVQKTLGLKVLDLKTLGKKNLELLHPKKFWVKNFFKSTKFGYTNLG